MTSKEEVIKKLKEKVSGYTWLGVIFPTKAQVGDTFRKIDSSEWYIYSNTGAWDKYVN